jgi:hypothetical protein
MGDPVIVARAAHSLSRREIDADALKVLYRLHQNNYIAYLVGGSVRDLLLGRRPKDFDIGTSAHPYQVKRLFKNSWVIGRRFRLAHVRFGTKTIEVATFRRLVTAEELATAEEQPHQTAGTHLDGGGPHDKLVHRHTARRRRTPPSRFHDQRASTTSGRPSSITRSLGTCVRVWSASAIRQSGSHEDPHDVEPLPRPGCTEIDPPIYATIAACRGDCQERSRQTHRGVLLLLRSGIRACIQDDGGAQAARLDRKRLAEGGWRTSLASSGLARRLPEALRRHP